MKRIIKIFWLVLKTIAFVLLFVLLVSSFSDRVSPYTCILFPYLGLFFPFILLANIVFFVFFLLCRKWKIIIFYVVVLGACYGSIHAYFPIHTRTQQVPEGCIKLLTYNVMRFEGIKNHTAKRPNQIVQYIANCDADIICIQEYAATPYHSDFLDEDELFDALKSTPYHYIEHLRPSNAKASYGLALFSKFPILKTEKVNYESLYNGSFRAELDVNGKRVTIINNHLESNKLSSGDRGEYYDLTKEMTTEKLENFTSRMFKRLTPAYRDRALQAQEVDKLIRKDKNPYIIVCGDFNDTPISYARHKIKGDLEDAFVESGLGMGISYNRYRFLFRIDYILHSRNVEAYNCTVGKLKNSDHYPVWTYLKLK